VAVPELEADAVADSVAAAEGAPLRVAAADSVAAAEGAALVVAVAVAEGAAVLLRPEEKVGPELRVPVAVEVNVHADCVAVAVHALWDALAVAVAERVDEGVDAAVRVEVAEAVAVAEEVGGRHARMALSGGGAYDAGRGTHVAVGCGVRVLPVPGGHESSSYSTKNTWS
jgi:hypothetical protein